VIEECHLQVGRDWFFNLPLKPESSGEVLKSTDIQASPAEIAFPLDVNPTSQEVLLHAWLRLTYLDGLGNTFWKEGVIFPGILCAGSQRE